MPSRLLSAQVASALGILMTVACCVSWMPERRTKTSRDLIHVLQKTHPNLGGVSKTGVGLEITHAAATIPIATK